ncbi:MAG: TonB-dependent receptor domain-containing protein, partial [Sandaracinobacteroides sp.]
FGEHKLRFTNLYIRDVLKQARITRGTDERNVGPGVEVNRGVTNWFERQLFSTSLVGEFKFDELKLDLRGTYAKSNRDAPYERSNEYVFNSTLGADTNSLRGSGQSSSISFSNLEDVVWAGAADVAYSFGTERPLTLSAGYAYTDNTRESTRREFDFLPNGDLPVGVIQQRPDFLLSEFNILNYDIVLQETTGIEGAARYDADLQVHAGYGQVEAELFDGFRISGGVRYESGSQSIRTLTLAGAIAQEVRIKENYWLPAITATWNFAEDMQVRIAASKTVARPQFRELAPQQYTDTDNDRTSIGNPFLIDSELTNFEGRFEWFLGRDERLIAGGFYKKIENPIETVTFSSGGGDIFTSFANAPEAQLYGFEIEGQKLFPLDGSGFFEGRRIFVSANYTYSDSKLKVSDGDTTRPVEGGGAEVPASFFFTDGDPLTGQSDHVANLQLGLQHEDRLSEQTILLTYASDRVSQRGPNDTPDFIERPGVQLDFVLREAVNIGNLPLEVKLEVRNILGTEYLERQSLNGSEIVNNRYDRGTSFSFGVTAKF